jgi:AcrR family transcriptional regulator
MGSTERRERERVELRAKILDAARELFVSDGYDAVTMRKIAERIEYSPTAIYLHFKDKAALLQELVSADFGNLASHFMKLGRIADPIERLAKCGKAYVDFGLDHPNHYLLMFTMTAPEGFEAKDKGSFDDPRKSSYAFMRDTVAEAMEKKLLRPELDDVELVAQMLWAAVHGIVSLEFGAKQQTPIPKKKASATTTLMMDVLVRGLVRAPKRAR